jgi:hypothetical protein
MGMALYWIWVFDHFIDLEDIVKSVQSKADAWIDADSDQTTWTADDAQKTNLRLEDSTNCAACRSGQPSRCEIKGTAHARPFVRRGGLFERKRVDQRRVMGWKVHCLQGMQEHFLQCRNCQPVGFEMNHSMAIGAKDHKVLQPGP